MKHLFLAIHHPTPEHAADLIDAMARFGDRLEAMPGMLQASAWRDGERIVAISMWDSPEAFMAAGPAMATAVADVPFADWEERPRELFRLDEIGMTEP